MIGLVVCGVLGATGKPWWTPLIVLLAAAAFTASMLAHQPGWPEAVANGAGVALVLDYAAYAVGRGGRWAIAKLWQKKH